MSVQSLDKLEKTRTSEKVDIFKYLSVIINSTNNMHKIITKEYQTKIKINLVRKSY